MAQKPPGSFAYRDAIMAARLTQSEKDVLHVIVRHMSFRRGAEKPHPSEYRIALMAGICERTARTTIKALEKPRAMPGGGYAAILKVTRRYHQNSQYTINYTALCALHDERLDKDNDAPA